MIGLCAASPAGRKLGSRSRCARRSIAHNLYDLENIARLLLEDVGLPSFGTNEAAPIGSGCKNAGEIALTVPERVEAMATLVRLQERYPGRLKPRLGPRHATRCMARWSSPADGSEDHAVEDGLPLGLWMHLSSLDVLHDGSIVPCNMLPELVLGHIARDRFQEIWRRIPSCRLCANGEPSR